MVESSPCMQPESTLSIPRLRCQRGPVILWSSRGQRSYIILPSYGKGEAMCRGGCSVSLTSCTVGKVDKFHPPIARIQRMGWIVEVGLAFPHYGEARTRQAMRLREILLHGHRAAIR